MRPKVAKILVSGVFGLSCALLGMPFTSFDFWILLGLFMAYGVVSEAYGRLEGRKEVRKHGN